ncbi:hypothetical protein V6N13_040414 [Hibiscus sabdariffa]
MDSDLLCAMESLNFTEEEAAVVSEISDERHVLSSCKAKPAADDGKKLQYGSWLRVSTQHPRPRKRTRIEYFTAPDSEPIVSPSSSCFPDGFTADIAATEKGVPTAANATEGEVPAAAY